MRTYSYEELREHIIKELENNERLIKARPHSHPNQAPETFIKLEEDICYTPYWHGGALTFRKGDYLHADPRDIYGLTQSTFERCYVIQHND